MYKHVFIREGLLSVPGTWLQWQVRDAAGELVKLDHVGRTFYSEGHIAIEYGRAVFDYYVDEYPTRESVEMQNGWDYARTQKRRILPKGKSNDFMGGWRTCWAYRRPQKDDQWHRPENAPMDFTYKATTDVVAL